MARHWGAVNAQIRGFRVSHPANHFGKMQQSPSTYRARQHVERIVFSIALGYPENPPIVSRYVSKSDAGL